MIKDGKPLFKKWYFTPICSCLTWTVLREKSCQIGRLPWRFQHRCLWFLYLTFKSQVEDGSADAGGACKHKCLDQAWCHGQNKQQINSTRLQEVTEVAVFIQNVDFYANNLKDRLSLLQFKSYFNVFNTQSNCWHAGQSKKHKLSNKQQVLNKHTVNPNCLKNFALGGKTKTKEHCTKAEHRVQPANSSTFIFSSHLVRLTCWFIKKLSDHWTANVSYPSWPFVNYIAALPGLSLLGTILLQPKR